MTLQPPASPTGKPWNVPLNSGYEIPILGLGTYKALGSEVKGAIRRAIDLGYRHFDSADYYQNLHILGEVVAEAIASGQVTRSELFLTTKVWGNDLDGPGRLLACVRRNLAQAGLEYFDLVFIHWPMVFADGDEKSLPLDDEGKLICGTRPLTQVYSELETVQRQGLSRSIGISNFNSVQIAAILASGSIIPAVHQVEAHLYLAQRRMQALCARHGIVLTAFAPMGRGYNPALAFNLLDDPKLKSIALKYGKSAAQIALRYLLQRGIVAIPKTVHLERLEENWNLFDFEISEQDMEALFGLDCNRRLVWWPETKNSPDWPFHIEF